jgi:exopolysaccharide production protein ExoZ
MRNQKQNKNINSLQMLRAVAVFLVICHHSYRLLLKHNGIHYPHFDLFEYAALGVDLFFVLSGFIMFYIHHLDIGKGINHLKTFLIKRIVRIYPVYWVVTIGLMLFEYVVSQEKFPIKFLVNSFLLLPDSKQPILGVAWSLIHEMFFYLMFALLILTRKVKYVIFTWVTGMIFMLINPINLSDNAYLNLIFNPINLEFLVGCMSALLFLKFKLNPQILIIVGIASFVFSIFLEYTGVLELHRFIAWGIPSFILILGLVNLDEKIDGKVPKFIVFIGNASYSIYLTHIVAISIFGGFISHFNLFGLKVSPLIIVLFFVILQVILGCLFYLIVEKPILNYLINNLIKKKKYITFEKSVAR